MTNHNRGTSHHLMTRSSITLVKIIVPHNCGTATNNYKNRNYSLCNVSNLDKKCFEFNKK